jgi:hypothetical protein
VIEEEIMDLQLALQAGTLLQKAYQFEDTARPNYDGLSFEEFDVIQTIYADDLATDVSILLGGPRKVVSIGYVARNSAAPTEFAIVVRGTVGVWEWLQDAKFLPIPFTAVAGGGLTEDGFTDMYMTFRVGADPNSASFVKSLPGLLGGNVTKLTICGHSLGSALATLLTMDVVVNTPYRDPHLYTFASPRVGDLHFANFFNSVVPDCFRIANRMDLVTHIPVPPLFLHVGDLTELNPGNSVVNNPACQHDIYTYMFMLSPAPNPLNPKCAPVPQTTPAPAPVETGGA